MLPREVSGLISLNLFGTDPKYKNKPLWSAGLNWRLSQEEFVKQIHWIEKPSDPGCNRV